MSDTEVMLFAIVGHIHEIQAGITPLLIELKLKGISSGTRRQMHEIYVGLTEILNTALENCADATEGVDEETSKDLFTELMRYAQELHEIIVSLDESAEIRQEKSLRELIHVLRETLQDSQLLS